MSAFRLLDRFWTEPVSRRILPNGLTSIVKRDRSAALASVQVWVKSGSIHEGTWLGAGISHYVEHMLFKGTERRAGREISATVQAHGGYINAYTTFDRTVYYIDLPSEHAPVALDLLSDAVLRSTLPADEAAKEKEVILREIAMTRDDPDDRLWQNMFSQAFREHPYRYPIIGHRELFERLSREDLAAYYRARYQPNNLVVVVAGDVDPDAMQETIASLFGGFSRGALSPVLVPEEPGQLGARELRVREDVEIARAAVAWQVPGLTHPDAPVLDLLSMVLGHGESSILWQELREKTALVHTIDASCWNPGTRGLFCIAFTTDGGKREAAEAALMKLLARHATRGFSAAAIRQAIQQLIAGEVSARQTMSGQASRLGAAEVVAGDLEFSRHYYERLQGVGPADLKRVLKNYCRLQNRTAVSSDPEAKAAAPVQEKPPRRVRPPKKGAPAEGDFVETLLPNGARLLLQHEPRLPQVHFRLVWQGGPSAEAPTSRGSTALLSTLLAKDTKKRPAAAVARYIESVGGSFYPFCGNNSLGLSVEVLPTDWRRAVDVLGEAVLAPAFLASTVQLERDAQVAGLRQDEDDVVTAARKLLRRHFFGEHPLRLDAHGEVASVEALRAPDLSALYRRLTVGSNAVLAVAGDFRAGEIVGPLKAFLGKIPAAKGAVSAVEPPLTPQGRDLVERRDKEQSVVLRGYPGPALHTPDYYVSEVADELFSGMASRLFERVREEKSLAYFVRSSRITGLRTAMFSFIAGTRPGREGEVLVEIDAEIERVASGAVEAAELARCHARLKAARRQSLQTNASRSLHAALNALQGQPINDWKNYDARIEAVTVADLAKFAQRYFQRGLCTQLLVMPGVNQK